ncbi:MAG TPA: cell division protein FtsA [Bacteroidales bacterium]|nr:cell division protein FtsA [Bacteroidales bacterium]HPS74524.1 cell division protein FtsA [Bacteroidales bacterium]
MKSQGIIVGLDIGTTKIAVIVGQKNDHGKVEILGYGKVPSIGVKRGVVSNIENTIQSIKEAVEEASQKSGVNINVVNVGIAGQHIKSMYHRGSLMREDTESEISQEDIDKLCNSMFNLNMNPGEEILEVIPQEFSIDNENCIRQPRGMSGNHLEANFHIIIGQTAAAKNIYKCVRRAGLEVSDLILEPIASAEAVLSEEEKEAGVVLVDIGGGTSDIAIFHEGIIRHTAVIPLGGEIISEDVKEGCSIIKKHAEELKIRFGSALASENKDEEIIAIPGLRGRAPKEISLKNLASIIQARMEEIIEHIFYEIRNSGYEKKLIGGIVLTGGGAMLKHAAQLTEFMTGLDTRIGYPNEHLAKDVPPEMASPMFATSIGLVLVGIDRYDKEMARLKELEPVFVEESSSAVTESVPKQKREKKKKVKETSEPGKKFTEAFLEKIKNWFDEETE